MAKINLDKMNLFDLKALQTEVEQAIEKRRDTDRSSLKDKMAEMANEAGFSIDDLFGKSKGKKSSLAPKYRNPDDPSKTWSGRGRKPEWLKQRLKAGESQEGFLIK